MIIDCDRCTVRGAACHRCAVSFITPSGGTSSSQVIELDGSDLRSLGALANAGLIPPLRYVPLLAKAS